MKQNIRKLIALALVLCMVVPMAPTANAFGWGSWWGSSWRDQNSNDDPGMALALVEDQDTVSEDVQMRAAVYEAAANDPVAQAELEGNNVVYYPSTFFDYDEDAINQSMANMEVQYAVDNGLSTSSSGWKWKGLYFGEGGSTTGKNDREVSRTGTAVSGEATYTKASTVRCSNLAGSNVTNAATNYYYLENGTYYPVTVTRSSRSSWGRTYYTYTLFANGKQIWTSGETTSTSTTVSGVDLYTLSAETTTVTSSTYETWVKWGGNDTAAEGPYIHSGITTGVLVDGVPQFQAPYASRLFDASEVSGKTRYTNVGLPFILDEDGYYTFDSSFNGAYFPDGEAKSDVNLTLLDAPTVKQGYKQVNGQWRQAYNTCFMPFDEPAANAQSTTVTQTDGTERTTSAYRVSTGNYFFSMITPIPFTMTENGKINPDENSDDIVFEFSGDDDVWVFIDDVLVLDLGGIHDAVYGEINFATNEISFETCASGMPVGDAMGTYGPATSGEAISQGAIFNDGDTVGKLNIDRSTFAATDNHTLTVVYMERGANLSNNKIRFNLPQKDYVSVTKQIDGNLYLNTDETTVVGQISNELFETLNQRNFTYILYQDGSAMTGARFSRYDANGNFIGNGTTASNGTFNVKNGETVRFYGIGIKDENFAGHSYHVAEVNPDYGSTNNAWGDAAWNHNIMTAYGGTNDEVTNDETFTISRIDKEENVYYMSDKITAEGSSEAVDVISFVSTNKLLSPVADIADDEYVIDFGLAVELNPLANDTFSATTARLTLEGVGLEANGTYCNSVTGEFGTLEIKNGEVVYTLNQQFTGADVFYYQVGLDNGDELEDVYGTITIMPATTMYYEESFAALNLTGSWTPVGTEQGGYQEEGRVGTTTDSPYGSDVLYLNNSGDSYGTSKYVNTENAAATFSYTFTGIGSALYARTSDKSAYMMIKVTDEDGNEVYSWNRNTIYKPVADTTLTDNTLYNIPVFVYQADAYGTYTVSVTLSKAIMLNGSCYRGYDFYLDGIRVYNPANAYTDESADPEITMIEDAYARDGEAYITVDSLRNKLLSDYTMYTPVLDENGEPVVDEYGDIVYEVEWDGVNYVVFTDSNGEIRDAQTYQSAGPKEEVYMKAGQSVTFALDNWDQNQNKVFLGIKAPSGSGVVSINGNTIEINNTTDIYYDITKYAMVSGGIATFKITAESALISVTTIKVTGTADFTIVSGGAEMPEEEIPEDWE